MKNLLSRLSTLWFFGRRWLTSNEGLNHLSLQCIDLCECVFASLRYAISRVETLVGRDHFSFFNLERSTLSVMLHLCLQHFKLSASIDLAFSFRKARGFIDSIKAVTDPLHCLWCTTAVPRFQLRSCDLSLLKQKEVWTIVGVPCSTFVSGWSCARAPVFSLLTGAWEEPPASSLSSWSELLIQYSAEHQWKHDQLASLPAWGLPHPRWVKTGVCFIWRAWGRVGKSPKSSTTLIQGSGAPQQREMSRFLMGCPCWRIVRRAEFYISVKRLFLCCTCLLQAKCGKMCNLMYFKYECSLL